MAKCIFAGTFDPMTVGHVSIIKKLKKRYKSVLVVIGNNPNKTTYFSLEEREKIARLSLKNFNGVKVLVYENIKEDYKNFISREGYTVYARGIRNSVDFNYEKKSEDFNKKEYPNLTTEYFNANIKQKNVSSSLVRDKLKKGLDYKKYLSKKAYAYVKQITTKR